MTRVARAGSAASGSGRDGICDGRGKEPNAATALGLRAEAKLAPQPKDAKRLERFPK
jgi:hypothetical protein